MSYPYFMVSDPRINFGYPSCLVSDLVYIWSDVMMTANFLSKKIDCLMLPPGSKVRKNPLVSGMARSSLTFRREC